MGAGGIGRCGGGEGRAQVGDVWDRRPRCSIYSFLYPGGFRGRGGDKPVSRSGRKRTKRRRDTRRGATEGGGGAKAAAGRRVRRAPLAAKRAASAGSACTRGSQCVIVLGGKGKGRLGSVKGEEGGGFGRGERRAVEKGSTGSGVEVGRCPCRGMGGRPGGVRRRRRASPPAAAALAGGGGARRPLRHPDPLPPTPASSPPSRLAGDVAAGDEERVKARDGVGRRRRRRRRSLPHHPPHAGHGGHLRGAARGGGRRSTRGGGGHARRHDHLPLKKQAVGDPRHRHSHKVPLVGGEPRRPCTTAPARRRRTTQTTGTGRRR